MTVSEAAEKYGKDAAGVFEMVASGELVAHRLDAGLWQIEEARDGD